MNMQEAVADCNICHFMPKQLEERVLRWWIDEGKNPDSSLVLVIDDASSLTQRILSLDLAKALLGDVPFIYTNTIRCCYGIVHDGLDLDAAAASCSVWTRHLLPNRLLTLATKRGLLQMGIEQEKKPPDMFRSKAFGLVLCILPLSVIAGSTSLYETYRAHTQRILREAGLI